MKKKIRMRRPKLLVEESIEEIEVVMCRKMFYFKGERDAAFNGELQTAFHGAFTSAFPHTDDELRTAVTQLTALSSVDSVCGSGAPAAH
ncbi:hypothetical protein Csa_023474 [Cucumis sativus]|uniref:Uncharacterized protein n=1 Tax=Cucumis sativus TaxID=3659 RepID=A0A0A0LGA0_CUCSA|nr:hypothetical protein Csa_023474 [Cucumis sativus]